MGISPWFSSLYVCCYIEKLSLYWSWFYTWSLPNLIIVSRNFLVEIWGSLMYNISSASVYRLTPSFPVCIHFSSFSFLIAPTSTSSTMLKSDGLLTSLSCSFLSNVCFQASLYFRCCSYRFLVHTFYCVEVCSL